MSAVPFLRRRSPLRDFRRSNFGYLAVAGLLVVTGCGGGNDDPSQSQSPPVTIRGGERLTWNQTADSVAQLRSLTFRLYLDGSLSELSSLGCDETVRPAGFECSGGLPPMSAGQHTLELTSLSGGVESERSRQLRVIVEGATSAVGVSPLAQSAQIQSTICSSEPSTDCYGVRLIASDLGRITALTSMPDGRVTFIENGQQVRVIGPDALSTAIALPVEGDRRLTGLTLDTNFEESHFVFVAWTEPVNGVPSLNLTRYREVGNMLGEPATIVTALPIAPDVTTPLAVDGEGLVYIAMPAEGSDSQRRSLSEAGVVLRVDRDGRVPKSNQYGSPIVAEGYPLPLGLAIARSTDTLWLSGRDQDQVGKIATIGIPTVRRGSWPGRPVAVGIQPAEDADLVESIAVVSQRESANSPTRLLIATGGRVRSVVLTLEGAVRNVSDIPLGNGYYSRSVAADRNGFLYVGVETREGSASLLKLTALTR